MPAQRVTPGTLLRLSGTNLNSLPSTFTLVGLLATITIVVYAADNFSASFYVPVLPPGLYQLYYGQTSQQPGFFAGELEILPSNISQSTQLLASSFLRTERVISSNAISPVQASPGSLMTLTGLGINAPSTLTLLVFTANGYSGVTVNTSNITPAALNFLVPANLGPNAVSILAAGGIYASFTVTGSTQLAQAPVLTSVIPSGNNLVFSGSNLDAQHVLGFILGSDFLLLAANNLLGNTASFSTGSTAANTYLGYSVQLVGTDGYLYPSSPTVVTAVAPPSPAPSPNPSPSPGPGPTPTPSPTPAPTLLITPANPTIAENETVQLTATVTGLTNQSVQWVLAPDAPGTLTASGLYSSPATITNATTALVTATSVANSSLSNSTTISLMPGVTTPVKHNYIIWIIVGFAVLIVLALLAYWLLGRKKNTATNTTASSPTVEKPAVTK